jgi:hypothetical protein
MVVRRLRFIFHIFDHEWAHEIPSARTHDGSEVPTRAAAKSPARTNSRSATHVTTQHGE